MFSITDELRKWAKSEFLRKCASLYDTKRLHEVNDLADAIEKELCERYVPLPLDADGVPVHIGDVMEWCNGDTFIVDGVGKGTLFCIDIDNAAANWTPTRNKHHHQPDSWERIIADAVAAGRCEEAVNVMPLIDRCKALSNDG